MILIFQLLSKKFVFH